MMLAHLMVQLRLLHQQPLVFVGSQQEKQGESEEGADEERDEKHTDEAGRCFPTPQSYDGSREQIKRNGKIHKLFPGQSQ